jgi:2-desacetyl-2-hydroxyethyl bacteriochlorophyllide A dehydrogenase
MYRGQWPVNLPVDETIPALAGTFGYPLKYGYCVVGEVVQAGSHIDSDLLGKTVFSFNPHESHFVAPLDNLVVLPESLSPEEAAFLPNMETAVGFLMDGRPLIGEFVAVFGQGVVGLLTVALLSQFPLGCLVAADKFPLRRDKSAQLGASAVLDPDAPDFMETFKELLRAHTPDGGADLTYELSGNPSALDQAVAVTGYGGRIIIGSWYGQKRSDVDLGGHFHRSRIRILSSQVSTVAPELTGRWNKARRLGLAIRMLEQARLTPLITHRFSLSRAGEAYALLDEHPDQAIGVILSYEDGQ